MAWVEGEKIGPYVILGQLGQGGMATVYRAHHPELDRHVAIKVMHQSFQDDPSFQIRFQREAQIVAGLEHPNIVPVYDYQQHANQPYLVMKYIEGDTLKDRLRRGSLSLDEILAYMTAIGSALAYAHRRGVLHRDIKPSNILIDKENLPYIADFGLARIAQAGESTISADMLLGTPHYISPEQARGVKNVDGRADIYSLGIVLYELMVGRVPFTADTPYAIVHDHIYTPLPLPSLANPEIPPAVEEVLLKAAAKNPEERYASADELVHELRSAVERSSLTQLNPDRASIASVSLAKLRELQPQTYTPSPLQGSTRVLTTSVPQPAIDPRAARRWMWGGVVAFLFTCAASIAVILGAAPTFDMLLKYLEARQYLYVVPPDITASEAEALIEMDIEDPLGYLALARARWAVNEIEAGDTIILTGFENVAEQTRYLLTAANIARRFDLRDEAIAYTLLAFYAARGNPEAIAQARASGGEYLYSVALDPQELNLVQIVNDVLPGIEVENYDQAFPMGIVAAARHEITRGSLTAARRMLESLVERGVTAPELDLVIGDLAFAEGNTEQAIARWNAAKNAADAPNWVALRAQEQIDNLEDQAAES